MAMRTSLRYIRLQTVHRIRQRRFYRTPLYRGLVIGLQTAHRVRQRRFSRTPLYRAVRYSARKLFTGFASAAFIACVITVTSAIAAAVAPASASTHHCTCTR